MNETEVTMSGDRTSEREIKTNKAADDVRTTEVKCSYLHCNWFEFMNLSLTEKIY